MEALNELIDSLSDIPDLYERYKEARKGPDDHVLAGWGIPFRTPERALNEVKRQVAVEHLHKKMYGDFAVCSTSLDSWASRHYPTYRLEFSDSIPPWIEQEAREQGWDPEHLELKATFTTDDWYEPLSDSVSMMGYSLDKAEEWRTGTYESWGGTVNYEPDRPEPYSILIDFSGPRERRNMHWLTYTDDVVWRLPVPGMDRHRADLLMQEAKREQAEAMHEWISSRLSGRLTPTSVGVEITWRGEVVGEASLGGIEWDMTSDNALDCLLDHDLIGEAWADAQKWAGSAVHDLKARAARLLDGVILLPEAARKAATDVTLDLTE